MRLFWEHKCGFVREVDSGGVALPVCEKSQQARGYTVGTLQFGRGGQGGREEKFKIKIRDSETYLFDYGQELGLWDVVASAFFRVSAG